MAQLNFTRDEFDIMLAQVLDTQPIKSDMLYIIVEKIIQDNLSFWCNENEYLRYRGYEKDVLQMTRLRVEKKIVAKFLLRDSEKGVNDDPLGFSYWVVRVTKNIIKDLAKKVRVEELKKERLKRLAPDFGGVDYGHEDLEEKESLISLLQGTFNSVISLDNVSIYKILAWLAVFTIMLGENVTKIEATKILAKNQGKTLGKIYSATLKEVSRVPWLEISFGQRQKIKARLYEKNGESTFAETMFSEFFMLSGGVKDGKKSISDWICNINKTLKKRYRNTLILTEERR